MILAPLLLVGIGVIVLAGVVSAYALYGGEPAPPLPGVIPSTGGSGIPANDDEVEALARVIASEAGRGTVAEQRAIGWAVRNRFRNKSVYAVEHPWRAQRGSDPPFASSKDATDATRALAREILLADQAQDPTGGATSFFEPRLQDALAQAGALARAGETGSRVIDGVPLSDITRFKNYRKTAAEIRSSWSPGSTIYATAGRFEFWGSAKLFAQRGGRVREVVAGASLGDWTVMGEDEVSDAIDDVWRYS